MSKERCPRNPLELMVAGYRQLLPGVDTVLGEIERQAGRIPDAELRRQAVASIRDKRFHCLGGGVYSMASPERMGVLLRLIVALQTISDYLDNLCDRSTSLDREDFRQLHLAMRDAVMPGGVVHDYYGCRVEREDGYLRGLVAEAQKDAASLPGYAAVLPYVRELISRYCDLQVYKHLDSSEREGELLRWWERYRRDYPGLEWYEFAAATGSTLGVFALFLLACDPGAKEEDAQAIFRSYFPWVCGLHILLDYLIDQGEDRVGGDLNFVSYYPDANMVCRRFCYFRDRAMMEVGRLPNPHFHRMVVNGLGAMYLSDRKAGGEPWARQVRRALFNRAPLTTGLFYLGSWWVHGRKSKTQPGREWPGKK